MPTEFGLVLSLLLIVFACIAEYYDERKTCVSLFTISAVVFFSLIYASVLPDRIEQELVVPIYRVGNSQYIGFYDHDGYKIINLNERLQTVIPEGSKIKVVQISQGPYFGWKFTMSENRKYKLEIISEKP